MALTKSWGTTRRWRVLCALVFVAVEVAGLVGATDATASIAKVSPGDCYRDLCNPNTIVYSAAPGERNRLEVTRVPDGVAFRDAGAPIRAGRGCVPQNGAVLCTDPVARLHLRLGDGDDHLDASLVESVTAAGDAGADVLLGGSGGNHLVGGSGRDELRGGAEGDQLSGDGVLRPVDSDDYRAPPDAPASPDVIDGGGGRDFVDYAGRTVTVSVDLSRDRGGSPGEGDRLVSIEGASGGAAGDLLRGDGEDNGLDGLGGDDVLIGAGGSDDLGAGQGDDLLRGGAGDDVLRADGRYGVYGGGTPGRDRLLCSAGSDGVESAEMSTYVSPGCERIEIAGDVVFDDIQLRLPLQSVNSPSVGIEDVFCVDVPCRTGMTFRLARRLGKLPPGTLVGRQNAVHLRAGGKRRCQRGVRLTASGRRLLRARRRPLVKFTIRQDFYRDGRRESSLRSGFLTRLVLGGGRSPEEPPPSRAGGCFGP